jgi:hypothetical protein
MQDQKWIEGLEKLAMRDKDYKRAWQVASELAAESPPNHPIHMRLRDLEAVLQKQDDLQQEAAAPGSTFSARRPPVTPVKTATGDAGKNGHR